MNKYLKGTIGLLFVTIIIGACNVAHNYQSPQSADADLYRGMNTTDTTNFATLSYTEVFNDTILQRLITDGINNNLNLQVAYTRVRQAEAYYLQSGAALLPTLNSNASVSVAKLSEAQGFGIRNSATQYQIGVSSSWEADIWGKLSSNRRANLANFLQSDAAARAVKTGVVSSVANYYYSLMALDEQLRITEQTVANWDTTVQTIKALKESARVTEAAVVQSQAQRYAAEVTIPDLKQRIRETENALSIVLGRSPSAVPRARLQDEQVTGVMQTGVPAQLLANRPDVQQAELNYRYNYELTNVARAYFYPSLTLTGSAAMSSLRITDFFNIGSFAASIAAGLTQPIFNQRTNRTRFDVALAQQDGAFLTFKNTLLTAGQEVSNAMYQYDMALEKMTTRANLLDALQKSVEYSEELLQYGFANYTEVITAKQSLLQAQLGSINDKLQQLQASVNLYRALGGGWR